MRIRQAVMHHITTVLLVFFTMAFSTPLQAECKLQDNYIILVHGGYVGDKDKNWTTPATLALTKDIVTQAQMKLAKGASALDVVVDAMVAFEDSGIVDAGKGSFKNSAGFVETDASIMVGSTGNSGAVAAMQSIKNPIKAARLVMEKTPHILFVGQAGEETLVELGAEKVDKPDEYFQPLDWQQPKENSHGTAGAVALDRCGELVAATSTGGTFGKMAGRVGDSPIIGASTFANNKFAFSATGKGEYFIKRGATRDIAARVEYAGMDLKEAADYVVKEVIGKQDGVRGAIIAISKQGLIVTSSTGYGLLHGYASNKIAPIAKLRAD